METGREAMAPPLVEAVQSFRLRVSFTGLCAFVPRGEGKDALERMDIFMIDPTNTEGRCPDVHTPVLSFDLKYLKGRGENGDLGGARGYWELKREDLEIFLRERAAPAVEERLRGSIRLRRGRKPGQFWEKPKVDTSIGDPVKRQQDFDAQKADFSWLPEIAQAIGEDAAVVPRDVADDPNPSDLAGARFSIAAGDFGTHSLCQYRDIAVAQFVPPLLESAPYVQAVAQSSGVDVDISAKFDVVIKATKFGKNIPGRELVLRAEAGEQVVVEVSNLCCGDYFEGQEPLYWKLEPDNDFSYLYLLCALYDDLEADLGRHWPVPIATKYPISAKNDTGGVSPIRCSGGVYNPVSLAGQNEGDSIASGLGRKNIREVLAKNFAKRSQLGGENGRGSR